MIVHLSAALRRLGDEVEVWQLHEWDDRYAEPRRIMQDAGVVQILLAVGAPWRRIGRIVADVADRREIDVLHLHGAFNVWNTLVSRALDRPYVFSPHSGYDPVSLQRSRLRKILYGLLFERVMLRRAGLLVALTEVELAQLRAQGARGPATVIPNGVEPPARHVDGAAFRTELGLDHDTPLAVFVGRLDVHRKGLDLLVRGLAEAPGWHLALVGPRFRDVERLAAMIGEVRLTERVHLVEPRYGRGLHEVLAAADVFTLVSRWEGLPMALLEALSYGRPAVVSPAVERLVPVVEAGAGWVADEGRLPEVLGEVAALGREELARRGEAARLLARRYKWDAVARQYRSAYQRALGYGEPVWS